MNEKDVRKLDPDQFAALSAELIDDNNGLRFRAHGKSMLPTITDGDILTVARTEMSSLRLGDLVLIQNDGSLLAHRIIRKGKTDCTTCGDALAMHDAPFIAEQLIGIIVSIEHNNTSKPVSRIKGLWQSRLRRCLVRFTG